MAYEHLKYIVKEILILLHNKIIDKFLYQNHFHKKLVK